jgi:hypothetical protein
MGKEPQILIFIATLIILSGNSAWSDEFYRPLDNKYPIASRSEKISCSGFVNKVLQQMELPELGEKDSPFAKNLYKFDFSKAKDDPPILNITQANGKTKIETKMNGGSFEVHYTTSEFPGERLELTKKRPDEYKAKTFIFKFEVVSTAGEKACRLLEIEADDKIMVKSENEDKYNSNFTAIHNYDDTTCNIILFTLRDHNSHGSFANAFTAAFDRSLPNETQVLDGFKAIIPKERDLNGAEIAGEACYLGYPYFKSLIKENNSGGSTDSPSAKGSADSPPNKTSETQK